MNWESVGNGGVCRGSQTERQTSGTQTSGKAQGQGVGLSSDRDKLDLAIFLCGDFIGLGSPGLI